MKEVTKSTPGEKKIWEKIQIVLSKHASLSGGSRNERLLDHNLVALSRAWVMNINYGLCKGNWDS